MHRKPEWTQWTRWSESTQAREWPADGRWFFFTIYLMWVCWMHLLYGFTLIQTGWTASCTNAGSSSQNWGNSWSETTLQGVQSRVPFLPALLLQGQTQAQLLERNVVVVCCVHDQRMWSTVSRVPSVIHLFAKITWLATIVKTIEDRKTLSCHLMTDIVGAYLDINHEQ